MDVAKFLAEDIETVDITSEALLADERAGAEITAKQDCVLAGLEEAEEIFSHLGLEVTGLVSDGERVSKGQAVLKIEGRAKDILAGERLALNFLSRMSGIATETRLLVDLCTPINPKVRIAATRKTTPGFRSFEKKAVELGGGYPHRSGLSDQFLIKDNHLALVPTIEEAVSRARESRWGREGKKVEIEVETLDAARRAVEAGADILMLDNVDPQEAEKGFRLIKELNSEVLVEISGGVTPDNIKLYAEYADRISLGYLTHSIKAADFSLEIVRKQ
ncbi:MAG: carboxylating nicotinate-nucleotide diphosphorylase [Thermoplasmata archaeon]|nr:MAG: carboxylating nicotinate-nucleotide diphosphorylase [Thermoplasmata archaeon]